MKKEERNNINNWSTMPLSVRGHALHAPLAILFASNGGRHGCGVARAALAADLADERVEARARAELGLVVAGHFLFFVHKNEGRECRFCGKYKGCINSTRNQIVQEKHNVLLLD
jgi:hypothetical protein